MQNYRRYVLSAYSSLYIACHRHGFSLFKYERETFVSPAYRQEECLTSKILKLALTRTACKEHSPPVAGRSLHEVGMTCTCNRVYAVRIEVALSKYRILLGRNERSKQGCRF